MARRAIIAGAGVGGLATALAMSRAGLDAMLCERAEALEEFGAGLQLTPNATRVLAKLGALADVRAVAMVPEAVVALRGSDDAVLMRLPLDNAEQRWGAPYLALHRADLQQALAGVAGRRDMIRLHLGSTVAAVAIDEDRLAVERTQGATTIREAADLLVGADGLRSGVREKLAAGGDDSLAFTGRVAFRATIPAELVDSRWSESRVVLRLGPNAHLVHYPLRAGINRQCRRRDRRRWRGGETEHPWDGVADRPALDRAFAGWSASTRNLIAAATAWRAWPLYGRPALGSFSLGRIALVGDAAHPMVPFLAQGAAQAIEDAGALGAALETTTIFRGRSQPIPAPASLARRASRSRRCGKAESITSRARWRRRATRRCGSSDPGA